MANELDLDEVGTGPNGCRHARMQAVMDGIDTVLTSNQVRTALSTVIDNATAPVVLTAAQKRRVILRWARERIQEVTT